MKRSDWGQRAHLSLNPGSGVERIFHTYSLNETVQPLSGVEDREARHTPNRFASLGVIHVQSFGLLLNPLVRILTLT